MARFDLHLNSSYSDGSDDIKVLLEKVSNAGIEIFALTDHDTVAGCNEMKQIVPSNILFIPSVELTCHSAYRITWELCFHFFIHIDCNHLSAAVHSHCVVVPAVIAIAIS